jgi:hypothetical protein
MAHQGLLAAALAAKDAESALVHGWKAFREASDQPEQQAELAVALGEVALLAGHPAAALAACLHAVRLTTRDHIRLGALGTAAIAAAGLGLRTLLDTLATDVRALVAQSPQPFENAYTMVELAEAYAHSGVEADARSFLSDALTLAEAGAFHEILHRAEKVSERLATDPRTRHAVRDEGVDAGSSPVGWQPVAALSRASRSVIRSLTSLPG